MGRLFCIQVLLGILKLQSVAVNFAGVSQIACPKLYCFFFFFFPYFVLGGGWGMQEELDSVFGEGFLPPLAAAVHSQLSLKQCDQEIQKPLYLLE